MRQRLGLAATCYILRTGAPGLAFIHSVPCVADDASRALRALRALFALRAFRPRCMLCSFVAAASSFSLAGDAAFVTAGGPVAVVATDSESAAPSAPARARTFLRVFRPRCMLWSFVAATSSLALTAGRTPSPP
jgi:hypothetical protein